MKKARKVLIAGIDTGIGKTVVTGLIAKNILEKGGDVLTLKMVQTGCDGFSEDLDEHRRLMGVGKFPEDIEGLTAPQIFKYPSSPLLAAKLEGKRVDLRAISAAVDKCATNHDLVLIEAAGGLDVPLTEDVLTSDFAAAEGWETILVTSGRLGAINHAILSLEVAKLKGLKLLGVVHNDFPKAADELNDDAIAAIHRTLKRLDLRDVVVEVETGDYSPLFKED